MSNEIKFFYTSGCDISNTFESANKSLGGLVTSTEVASGLNQVFNTVSMNMLAYGSIEYRCLFFQNKGGTAITNLNIFTDIPLLSPQLDPANLVGLNDGDKFIVPVGATGLWNPDSEDLSRKIKREGYVATYVASSNTWTFEFGDFASYEFGFAAPIDVTIDEVEYLKAFVSSTSSIYSSPAGISFVSADNIDNKKVIGDGTLANDAKIAIWIKRTVKPRIILPEDIVLNEGTLELIEKVKIDLNYDTP